MSTRTRTQNSKKRSASTGKKVAEFTTDERAAMKDRVKELKANNADGESDLLAKIAEMSERTVAKRIHVIVTKSAPELSSRTGYGRPAYAKDDKVVCFFKPGEKFKARYATLGFSDKANLDEGAVWPTEFAVKELTAAAEARIAALVKKAVS